MNAEDRKLVARWPVAAGVTAFQRQVAQDLMQRCADRAERCDRAVNRALAIGAAVVLGVAGAWAMVAYLTPCEAGALCTAPLLVPTRRWPWTGLAEALRLRARAAYFDALAEHAEEDVLMMETDLASLPRRIGDFTAAISRYRAEAIRCRADARAARGM